MICQAEKDPDFRAISSSPTAAVMVTAEGTVHQVCARAQNPSAKPICCGPKRARAQLNSMEAEYFDEEEFFSRIASSGARALLIGRRALIVLGIPVNTFDYDFWIHIDDIETFNGALVPLGFEPNRLPGEARKLGRYVLEDGEHVDVLVARSVPTVEGIRVHFEEVWVRRQTRQDLVALPAVDDLILTKRFGSRPKDLEDIRLLTTLKTREP